MTDDEIKNLAEVILSEEEDCYVPIKKLAELINQEKEHWNVDYQNLQCILNKDERFKIFDFDDKEDDFWDDEEDLEMQNLGYYKGARVMLLARQPSKDDIVRMLEQKTQNALDALKQAYNMRPNLSDEEEAELLAVMMKTKHLKQGILELNDDNDDYFKPT